MIGRNHVIEMELIEQLALIALQPPHHRKPPPLNGAGTESLFAANSNRLLQQNLPIAAVNEKPAEYPMAHGTPSLASRRASHLQANIVRDLVEP